MLYKILAWIILSTSVLVGGAFLVNAQAKVVPISGQLAVKSLVAAAKSGEISYPFLNPLMTESPDDLIVASQELTPTETSTPTPEPKGGFCTGLQEADHPMAVRIANEFGVSTDEVMAQFCQGRGFGEIELGYAIAANNAVPAADVFAKRDTGEGWGNIMHDYGIHGNPKNGNNNPGRGRGKGKD